MTIALKVNGERHFTVAFARPGRIEVDVTEDGEVIAHVYEGAMDQSPLIGFDSTVGENEDWQG